MKKLLAVLALSTTLSFSVGASNDSQDICLQYSELATEIMRARQNDKLISDIYPMVKDSDISIEVLKWAYEKPLESTPEGKETITRDFTNEVFMICINVYGDKESA
jgi:hypothetical protein